MRDIVVTTLVMARLSQIARLQIKTRLLCYGPECPGRQIVCAAFVVMYMNVKVRAVTHLILSYTGVTIS